MCHRNLILCLFPFVAYLHFHMQLPYDFLGLSKLGHYNSKICSNLVMTPLLHNFVLLLRICKYFLLPWAPRQNYAQGYAYVFCQGQDVLY